jgi:hypothetical protein
VSTTRPDTPRYACASDVERPVVGFSADGTLLVPGRRDPPQQIPALEDARGVFGSML